jgi:hypothetical protein
MRFTPQGLAPYAVEAFESMKQVVETVEAVPWGQVLGRGYQLADHCTVWHPTTHHPPPHAMAQGQLSQQS